MLHFDFPNHYQAKLVLSLSITGGKWSLKFFFSESGIIPQMQEVGKDGIKRMKEQQDGENCYEMLFSGHIINFILVNWQNLGIFAQELHMDKPGNIPTWW